MFLNNLISFFQLYHTTNIIQFSIDPDAFNNNIHAQFSWSVTKLIFKTKNYSFQDIYKELSQSFDHLNMSATYFEAINNILVLRLLNIHQCENIDQLINILNRLIEINLLYIKEDIKKQECILENLINIKIKNDKLKYYELALLYYLENYIITILKNNWLDKTEVLLLLNCINHLKNGYYFDIMKISYDFHLQENLFKYDFLNKFQEKNIKILFYEENKFRALFFNINILEIYLLITYQFINNVKSKINTLLYQNSKFDKELILIIKKLLLNVESNVCKLVVSKIKKLLVTNKLTIVDYCFKHHTILVFRDKNEQNEIFLTTFYNLIFSDHKQIVYIFTEFAKKNINFINQEYLKIIENLFPKIYIYKITE